MTQPDFGPGHQGVRCEGNRKVACSRVPQPRPKEAAQAKAQGLGPRCQHERRVADHATQCRTAMRWQNTDASVTTDESLSSIFFHYGMTEIACHTISQSREPDATNASLNRMPADNARAFPRKVLRRFALIFISSALTECNDRALVRRRLLPSSLRFAIGARRCRCIN
jgi:hypothetical protein